jgi:hypothetical protein
MIRTGYLRRCIAPVVVALTLTFTAANANDDTIQDDETFDAGPMFDEPVDFSTPISPLASVVDASRFLHGLPSSTWSSKAGIDSREAAPYADLSPLPNAMPHQTVGVAWATITAPGLMAWDRTAFETRVDPYQESRLGVTISRSVPFGSDVSMTLQNTLAWSQSLLQEAPIVAHGSNAQTVEENHAVSFTFRPVNTTFSIGATHSNADESWRRSLSGEQRLFGGPVSITGAVSETGTGEFDRSLKAGFKRNW